MPVDFASVIRAGQSLVPDIRQQMMQDEDRQAMNDQRAALNEQRRVATEGAQQEQARKQELRTGLNQAILSGDPRAITKLMAQFPEYANQIKPGWEGLLKEERQRNQTQVGTAYVRGLNGDFAGAAAALQDRYDADVAAEQHDPHTKELIDELKGDDPQRRRIAVSTLGIYLAADDPDKFSQLYPDMAREARLTELQPYEVAAKKAQAEAAPDYYDARADRERNLASTAASNARFADSKNAAQIDRAGAAAANARSMAERRNNPISRLGASPAPAVAPRASGKGRGSKEVIATDGQGNRARYNPKTKQWERVQ